MTAISYAFGPPIVGFSGSPDRPSSTHALVKSIIDGLGQALQAEGVVFDLRDVGPSLGMAGTAADLEEQGQRVVAAIGKCEILVVGTPVYNGSYGGMFKHFFDLLDPQMLYGKIVVLAATGGSARHCSVIDYSLRPLFVFFGANVCRRGVYCEPADFTNRMISNAKVLKRIDMVVADVAASAGLQPSRSAASVALGATS